MIIVEFRIQYYTHSEMSYVFRLNIEGAPTLILIFYLRLYSGSIL